MSRWKRPLKAAEVRKILRALGFEPKPLKATSHEQWTKRDGESFYKELIGVRSQLFLMFKESAGSLLVSGVCCVQRPDNYGGSGAFSQSCELG